MQQQLHAAGGRRALPAAAPAPRSSSSCSLRGAQAQRSSATGSSSSRRSSSRRSPASRPAAAANAAAGAAAAAEEEQRAPAACTHPRLLTRLVKAHGASITALNILQDTADTKLLVSASLDKSLATWKLTNKYPRTEDTGGSSSSPALQGSPSPPAAVSLPNEDLGSTSMDQGDAEGEPERQVQVVRLLAPRAPVFSIIRQESPLANGGVFAPVADVLFCGNAAKEMFAWEVKPCMLDDPCAANFQMVATNYTGWVRSLAMMGKWLFSCGCSCLRQHDTSYPLPKEVDNVEQAFKGDILTIAAGSGKVFAGCADGGLRSWVLNSKGGALTLGEEALGAHSSRVTGLALHGPHLYSVSLDGSIKVWRAQDLTCIAEVQAAHEGLKIYAIVLGPDDLIYTAGDDTLIRPWLPLLANEDFMRDLERREQEAGPTPVTPNTSVNAAGDVTSSFADTDEEDDSACDLGGNATPVETVVESAAAPAEALSPPSEGGAASSSEGGSSGSSIGSSGAGIAGDGAASTDISSSSSRGRGSESSTPTSSSNGGGSNEGSSSNGQPGRETGAGSPSSAGAPKSSTGLFALQPAPSGPLTGGHNTGVRVLSAGPQGGEGECLVSGDADGDLSIWAVPVRPPAPPQKPLC